MIQIKTETQQLQQYLNKHEQDHTVSKPQAESDLTANNEANDDRYLASNHDNLCIAPIQDQSYAEVLNKNLNNEQEREPDDFVWKHENTNNYIDYKETKKETQI